MADIRPRVLAVRTIPNVAGALAEALGLTDAQVALGFLTVDQDDPTYVAIDEATKKADVEVVYARSFYGGARHASGPTSGETVAVLVSGHIAEVDAGMDAALSHLESRVSFRSADGEGRRPYFAHMVARTGAWLADRAGIPRGEPPTPTNMAGALVTGSEADCRAACDAFEQAVLSVHRDPVQY